ncbi:MAG: Crp/Fnr family transcriptional regulator [Actinobacteria bacterium]|jgi:CRP/FNR family transcriptional regulator|nr:Crp/Fnr family transcriptional regulator [Actinomycetota bacterium]
MTPHRGTDAGRNNDGHQHDDHHAPAAHDGEDLCVARVPLFQSLPTADQRDVASVARPTRFDRGDAVYAPGSDRAQLMVVHTGALKISRVDADGREQILRVLGPGDFFGESALLTGSRPDHFATALEAGSMCVFRHADLDRLVRIHPSIGLTMLQTVSRRLVETENRLVSVISGDVSSRLADYLLSLPGRVDAAGMTIELPLAKKDIASLLDTTPESLSRQLRRLSDSGVIVTDASRQIRITDADALMGLASEP